MIEFLKASTGTHFKLIEDLASTIWNKHYIPIIGKAQVAYMLDKFQSKSVIADQVSSGYHYYILKNNLDNVGYICIKEENDSLFLSKLYVLKYFRGKGFGKQAMSFIETKAKELKCKSISLTVNKNNSHSIKAYEKLGFKNLGEIVIDIGNGFVMDDYRMSKIIK
ncbi:MAG: GNAT family N-acetyltransferase [Jejuia sp.]